MSFDWTVHHRDRKSGQITRTNEYRMTIVDGQKLMERPVDSGFWYAENGALVKEPQVSKPEFSEPVVLVKETLLASEPKLDTKQSPKGSK